MSSRWLRCSSSDERCIGVTGEGVADRSERETPEPAESREPAYEWRTSSGWQEDDNIRWVMVKVFSTTPKYVDDGQSRPQGSRVD